MRKAVMNCKICTKPTKELFPHLVLNKYLAKYHFCENCSFIQTENPYWLKEAYSDAIGELDTGILQRNILMARRATLVILSFFGKDKTYLDYGGGYGIFTRLMRDLGFDFFWSDKYAQNIFARQYEYTASKKEISLITSFECFEHFVEPIYEIENLLKISRNILFSTELFRGSPPKPDDWWYYNFEAGQHVSLYSEKTLSLLAKKYNLNFVTNKKSFHLFTEKKISQPLFNLVTKLSAVDPILLLRLFKKSKTESDMNFIKNLK